MKPLVAAYTSNVLFSVKTILYSCIICVVKKLSQVPILLNCCLSPSTHDMIYPYYDSLVRYYNQQSIVPLHVVYDNTCSIEDGIDVGPISLLKINGYCFGYWICI